MNLSGCGGKAPAGGPIDQASMFGEPGSQPGQFAYPRAIDEDGETVWVIDKLARVQQIDIATGDSLGEWRMPEWALGKPTGITVWHPAASKPGEDVIVIVPDTHYHRVMIYAIRHEADKHDSGKHETGKEPGGARKQFAERLVHSFGEYGEGDGQFIYPTDVVVVPTEDGQRMARLYVAEYGGHDRINIFDVTYDADGAVQTSFVSAFGVFGGGIGPSLELNRPQSMALDARNSELVVTDSCNHRIGRVSLDGKLVKWLGGAGEGPGEFSYPYGVVLLGDGTAMVSEFGNNRLQRIDLANGESLGIYGQAGRGVGQLATPWAMAIVGDKAVVLDSGNSRVQVFDKPTGRPRTLTSNGGARATGGRGG